MGTSLAQILDLMERLRERGEDFCAVTVVRTADATSAKAGAKAVVTADGDLHGFVGGGCVRGAVKRAAMQALTADMPRLIRVKPKDDVAAPMDTDGIELHSSSCPSGGTVDLFLEPMRRAVRIVICGASPVATVLAKLARTMGYRVVLAASPEDHGKVPADAYVDGFALEALEIIAGDAIVVLTQGKRDGEALKAALKSPAGYVGMVGSRKKFIKLRAQLSGDVPAARLDELHGPAGLDIGAIDPEEIALSILGEIVAIRRRQMKDANPIADGGGTTS